jgi:uncharacterized protein YndB with AHSA1/START domain
MIEAHGETTIAAPIERVFDYVADARNEPSWLPGAEAVEKTTPDDVGLGTRFEGRYARAGKVEVEVVSYERPHRLTLRGHSKILDFDDAIELTEAGGQTVLKATMSSRPRGPMKLMSPLMARTIRSQFADNWVHLKTALES